MAHTWCNACSPYSLPGCPILDRDSCFLSAARPCETDPACCAVGECLTDVRLYPVQFLFGGDAWSSRRNQRMVLCLLHTSCDQMPARVSKRILTPHQAVPVSFMVFASLGVIGLASGHGFLIASDNLTMHPFGPGIQPISSVSGL